MKTDDPISRHITRAFIDFLNSVDTRPDDVEALEVARDCLREVFSLDQPYGDDLPLPEPNLLVNAVTAQGVKHSDAVKGHSEEVTTVSAQNSGDVGTSKFQFQDNVQTREDFHTGVSKDETFGRFIAALETIEPSRTTAAGSDDNVLLDRAKRLFQEAVHEIESSECKTIDYYNLAEALKMLGNRAMQSKLYFDAIERYTCAIALRENNAIFYCNRAAAYTHLQQYKDAISDCLKAIEIDPNYSKAYSRLGSAYYAQGNYMEAIDKGFKKALELDPTNDAVNENLQMAVQKLKEQQERQQNGRSSGPNNWSSRNHTTGGGSTNQAAPSPFASFTFDAGSFPANFSSMFGNMGPNPHQGQNAQNREGANNDENRTSSTFPSMPFDAGSLPANFANMFTNFTGRASQGHSSDDQPQAGSDSNGYNDPGQSTDGIFNVSIEQLPEQVVGTLRSVMEMYQGVQERDPQANHDRQSESN